MTDYERISEIADGYVEALGYKWVEPTRQIYIDVIVKILDGWLPNHVMGDLNGEWWHPDLEKKTDMTPEQFAVFQEADYKRRQQIRLEMDID